MSPFIKDGDIVTVAPPESISLRSGDIVAFTYCGTDRLAIHRVVGVRGGSFLIKGDNASEIDGLVPASQVLGRVIKAERNGRCLRLGIGPERVLVAFFNRTGLLPVLLRPARSLYRLLVPRTPEA